MAISKTETTIEVTFDAHEAFDILAVHVLKNRRKYGIPRGEWIASVIDNQEQKTITVTVVQK